jgi:quercetin dioxygenase-like cupin family protein
MRIASVTALLAGVAVLTTGVAAPAQDRAAVKVTPLASTNVTATGQPLKLPENPAMVSASRYVIAPGARLPVHKHPHPRYAFVVAGNLTVYDADSGQRFDYGPGDFIVEILDGWHYGENNGSEDVVLLVVDQTPDGHPSNTVIRPQ